MQDSNLRHQRLVSGVAWAFIVIAAWGVIRLPLNLLAEPTPVHPDDFAGSPVAGFLFGIARPLMAVHLAIAVATLFAAVNMLSRKPWTRTYFGLLLLLLAEYAGLLTYMLIFEADGAGSAYLGIRIGLGVIALGLGILSGLLGWRFLRGEAIRRIFESK
ncbi:MAG: hypothetical protein AAF570_19535 [Bacteroidota bacterium]